MPDSQTELEAPSSGVEGQDVKPATESSTAESSTEVKVVEQNKPTMLDAVQKALAEGSEKSTKSELTPETTEGTVAKAAGEDDEAKDDEISPDELKTFSRGAQYRIRQLTAKGKVAEDQVRELQPAAEVFERITSVMKRNDLNEQDVDDGFEIMAAMKSQPKKALELLAPIVKKLLAATGHQLPGDLKERVEAGELSEADARELSVARATNSHLTATAEQKEQRQREADEDRQRTTTVDTAVKTADAWHAEKATTDPDWHLKQDRVVQLVELHVLRTKQFPRSDKEARALFEDALKTVNTELKQFIPRKPSIKPNSGNASLDAKPKPTSIEEAVKMSLQG